APLVGRTRPSRILTVVVLPAPFGPRKPKPSPGCTLSVRSCSATVRPYSLRRPTISSAGAGSRSTAVAISPLGLVETAGNALQVAGLQAVAGQAEGARTGAGLPQKGAADAGVVVEDHARAGEAAAYGRVGPAHLVGRDC